MHFSLPTCFCKSLAFVNYCFNSGSENQVLHVMLKSQDMGMIQSNCCLYCLNRPINQNQMYSIMQKINMVTNIVSARSNFNPSACWSPNSKCVDWKLIIFLEPTIPKNSTSVVP